MTRYLVAIAAIAAAVLLRSLLSPWMGNTLPLVTLFGAVALSVWWGGHRPALIAMVLGYIACAWLFIEPSVSLGLGRIENVVGLVAYIITCGIIIGLGVGLRVTERRARQRHEAMRTTLASIGDAVITTDTRGVVTDMNAVAESLTGWKKVEAVGRPLETVFRILNERTREPIAQPVLEVMSQGIVLGLGNHTILVTKDGLERPIDDSAAPIRSQDGPIQGCVLVFRDVTERRKAERDLLESRELLRTTLASIGDAVVTTDNETRITSFNAVAEQVTGWKAAETIGQPLAMVFRIVNEQTRQPVEDPVLRALRTGLIVGLANHTVLIRKDGSERPIDDSAAAIRDEEGKVAGCVLVFRDVTKRRRLERENAERLASARLLASIVESSHDAIVSKDLDGIIQTWNAAAERLFGYTAEEAIGRHISLIIPPDRADEEEMIIGKIRRGERVDHFDTVRMRSDGTPVQMSVTISPVRDEKGRVVGASKIGRDITEKKEVEGRLSKLMEELKENDRRKDEFLATLAHELRNPLAPIRNAVQVLLLKGSPDPELTRARDVIDRQVRQMARLLEDLLDVSRISYGKMELRKEPVVLKQVIDLALETSRALVQAGGHSLSISLPEEPIRLYADPVRLGQVFANLLNNAAKYTERGGNIRISAERQGHEAVVSVQDNGVGIDPRMLPRIFNLFEQSGAGNERSQGGLGIGLALVRKLVEMQGGTVEAHSEGAGQGCTFVVRLPISDPMVLQESTPAERRVDANGPGLRILIADDLKDTADSLAAFLRTMGHDVHTVYDGNDAVEAVDRLRPQVVLLDIGMPRMNGYEACRLIRQRPWGREIRLIAVTGWGKEADRRRSFEAGFDYHMVKPVDPEELLARIGGVSDAQSSSEPAQR